MLFRENVKETLQIPSDQHSSGFSQPIVETWSLKKCDLIHPFVKSCLQWPLVVLRQSLQHTAIGLIKPKPNHCLLNYQLEVPYSEIKWLPPSCCHLPERGPGERWRCFSQLPLFPKARGSCVWRLTASLLSLLWLRSKIEGEDGLLQAAAAAQDLKTQSPARDELDHEPVDSNLTCRCPCVNTGLWEVMTLLPGSGSLVAPEAHSVWLGQPWHDADFPACSLVVPGQSEKIQQDAKTQVMITNDYLHKHKSNIFYNLTDESLQSHAVQKKTAQPLSSTFLCGNVVKCFLRLSVYMTISPCANIIADSRMLV